MIPCGTCRTGSHYNCPGAYTVQNSRFCCCGIWLGTVRDD